MGVAKLKKAELYYHKSVHEEIARALQATGKCQIIGSDADAVPPSDVQALRVDAEAQLSGVRYLSRTLTPHFNDPVPSMDRLLGEKTPVTMSDLKALADKTDLDAVCARVRDVEHSITETKTELGTARTGLALLKAFSFFPWPLASITEGTKTIAAIAGVVKAEELEKFQKALAESECVKDTELLLEPHDDKTPEIHAVLFFSRQWTQAVTELCTKNGMSTVDVPTAFKGTILEEQAKVERDIVNLEAREAALDADMKAEAQKWMPTVQQLSDYWTSVNSRCVALGKSSETDRTMLTRFWLPDEDVAEVQKIVEDISPNVAISFSDPEPDEEPPTLLKNADMVRPFNILTTLYSPPKYRGTDPTPLLAPFFWLFFGMCLGDAGYAIVMIAAIWWVFKKYRNVPLGVRDFIVLFAYSAVATLIYGVISGSFFGNFIDSFVPFLVPIKDKLMLVDPMTNPMQVLGISLLLGVIHLMFGLLVAAYDHFRMGEWLEAVGENISWFLLIVGLCVFGVGLGGMLPAACVEIGKWMSIVGAVIVFLYAGREKKGIASKIISGFLALYGSTSYLGDILSYSRLLALGFGSAVIGMIINLLGDMAMGIPYIGWIIGIVVIAGGHMFSLLINILGAFVHPLRLQYVEFFGKFYTGGGEEFTPLRRCNEFVRYTD